MALTRGSDRCAPPNSSLLRPTKKGGTVVQCYTLAVHKQPLCAGQPSRGPRAGSCLARPHFHAIRRRGRHPAPAPAKRCSAGAQVLRGVRCVWGCCGGGQVLCLRCCRPQECRLDSLTVTGCNNGK
jgi:hypothetical protein